MHLLSALCALLATAGIVSAAVPGRMTGHETLSTCVDDYCCRLEDRFRLKTRPPAAVRVFSPRSPPKGTDSSLLPVVFFTNQLFDEHEDTGFFHALASRGFFVVKMAVDGETPTDYTTHIYYSLNWLVGDAELVKSSKDCTEEGTVSVETDMSVLSVLSGGRVKDSSHLVIGTTLYTFSFMMDLLRIPHEEPYPWTIEAGVFINPVEPRFQNYDPQYIDTVDLDFPALLIGSDNGETPCLPCVNTEWTADCGRVQDVDALVSAPIKQTQVIDDGLYNVLVASSECTPSTASESTQNHYVTTIDLFLKERVLGMTFHISSEDCESIAVASGYPVAIVC